MTPTGNIDRAVEIYTDECFRRANGSVREPSGREYSNYDNPHFGEGKPSRDIPPSSNEEYVARVCRNMNRGK